ncbi:hypothetical protein QBC34DRAFT_192982 [Podospora aff. communis PSN243]|uniref:Uncharacterized protein n=1 Tax=Podospora aff. communis PSN243 TaxID=3040156 RepID=A0AAV9H1E3_9PEZI|nr:hypothetical protein QBC34DRAFT_192982 [Podospora aff. communis PSN243]
MTVCPVSSSPRIMDVTSLLNSSSAAAAAAAAAAALQRRDSVESSTPSATGDTTASSTAVPTPSPERTPPPRRTSGSRSPVRNRTPWDAGGYSLPLTLDTKSIPSFGSTGSRPGFYRNCDSPTDCSVSPKSPRHKFSDSRSSLSSYASSSTNSISHSRISSLSTVSEFQPLTNLITDISLEGKKMPNGQIGDNAADRGDEPRPASPIIPSPSFGPTPIVGQPQENLNSSTTSYHPAMAISSERPTSPSDAVMIRRGLDGIGNIGNISNIGGISGVNGINGNGISGLNGFNHSFINGTPAAFSPADLKPEPNGLLSVESSPPGPAHRRAVSAPDFAPAMAPGTSLPQYPTSSAGASAGQQSLLLAQTGSLHTTSQPNTEANAATHTSRGHFRDFDTFVFVHPHTGERMTFIESLEKERARLEGEKAKISEQITRDDEPCDYTEDCALGSTPRKAISHLFGRNKACTRQIPRGCWVHFCRKHYQRSRYRNQDDYSKVQAKLVSDQIFRVQHWSNMNKDRARANEKNGVKDKEPAIILKAWHLTKRKREAQRADTKKSGSNKRRRPDDDNEDDDEEDDDNDPNFDQGVAVEGWLLAMCNRRYSTDEMLAIAHRIHIELLLDHRKKMPDIEILPEIEGGTDKSSAGSKTPASRRKVSHNRAKSMVVAPGSQSHEAQQMARRTSQPNVGHHYTGSGYWGSDPNGSPAEKRQRLGEMTNPYQTRPDVQRGFPTRNVERTIPMPAPNMHPLGTINMRTPFGSLRENASEGHSLPRPQHGAVTGLGHYSSQGPLPVPAPRGLVGASLASQRLGPSDQGGRFDVRGRPAHQRSVSDAGAMHQYSSQPYRPSGQEYAQPAFQPTGSYAATSNAYPSGTGYTTPSPYVADYSRQETAAHPTTSGTNGLPQYGNTFARAQSGPMRPYTGFGNGYGGGAKHTRHQSTPVAHQLPSMGYNTETSSFGSYSQYPARGQGSYLSGHQNMPPVDEGDATRDNRYTRQS